MIQDTQAYNKADSQRAVPANNRVSTRAHTRADIQAAISSGGLQGGLAYLNARVPHRFTAVYRVDGDVLRIVAIVDKAGKGIIPSLHEIPVDASFCQYSMRHGFFVSEDTGADHRLDGNPYQAFFGSYVGICLGKKPGMDTFTFCHYDLMPNPIADEELAYLKEMVPLLPCKG